MNTVKLAHKSLNEELWPNYLKLALIERKRNLRSSDFGPIIKQGVDQYLVGFLKFAEILEMLIHLSSRSMTEEIRLFQSKQEDDYTFQQQATVYNNVPKDFKEINDFKAFSTKIKGFYKDRALARVLSLS